MQSYETVSNCTTLSQYSCVLGCICKFFRNAEDD